MTMYRYCVIYRSMTMLIKNDNNVTFNFLFVQHTCNVK